MKLVKGKLNQETTGNPEIIHGRKHGFRMFPVKMFPETTGEFTKKNRDFQRDQRDDWQPPSVNAEYYYHTLAMAINPIQSPIFVG